MVAQLTETNFFFERNEYFRSLPQILCNLSSFLPKIPWSEIFYLFSASIGVMIYYECSKCALGLTEQVYVLSRPFQSILYFFFGKKLAFLPIFFKLEKNSEFPTFCLITFLTIFIVFYGLPGFQKILFEIILTKVAT